MPKVDWIPACAGMTVSEQEFDALGGRLREANSPSAFIKR
jgi:hypothetical protein